MMEQLVTTKFERHFFPSGLPGNIALFSNSSYKGSSIPKHVLDEGLKIQVSMKTLQQNI